MINRAGKARLLQVAMLIALILAAVLPSAASAATPWTSDDVMEARAQASPRVRCIVDHEVGGFNYDPYQNGLAGEQGPAQLHPQGKLLDFYQLGYTDPHNPWQAMIYLEGALRRGEGSAWTPVSLGFC